MLGPDLAELYRVKSKVLMQAVRRNAGRFPPDFMFRLTLTERRILRSQIVTSSWGGERYPPCAFTEQGVAMLSGVLRSSRATRANVAIMRAFVRLRRLVAEQAGLARRIDDLEQRYDDQFASLFQAIRDLLRRPAEPESERPRIGFHPGGKLASPRSGQVAAPIGKSARRP